MSSYKELLKHVKPLSCKLAMHAATKWPMLLPKYVP